MALATLKARAQWGSDPWQCFYSLLIVFCQFTQNNHQQMTSIAIITACHRWVAAEGKSPSKLVTLSGSRETISSTLITAAHCVHGVGEHITWCEESSSVYPLWKDVLCCLCHFICDWLRQMYPQRSHVSDNDLLQDSTAVTVEWNTLWIILCLSWSIRWGWILGSCDSECETSLALPSQLLDDTDRKSVV